MNREDLHPDRKSVNAVFESRFIKVYEMEYFKGKKYINASRRDINELAALKRKDDFQNMLPDAVSCIVIINAEEPKLLMNYEFRYPVGEYLLSVPAGLIDDEDFKITVDENDFRNSIMAKISDNKNVSDTHKAIISAALREIKEETNIELSENDRIEIINPLLFSTPGMTDESNALIAAVIGEESIKHLNQDGAQGTERFDGFAMLSCEDAKRIIRQGRDDMGIFYSVYTWAALMYFISGMWKN